MLNHIVKKGEVTACNNQIININQEIDECITTRVDKKGRVRTRGDKVEKEQEGAELLVPSSGRLFEPINSLV